MELKEFAPKIIEVAEKIADSGDNEGAARKLRVLVNAVEEQIRELLKDIPKSITDMTFKESVLVELNVLLQRMAADESTKYVKQVANIIAQVQSIKEHA